MDLSIEKSLEIYALYYKSQFQILTFFFNEFPIHFDFIITMGLLV